MCVIVLLGLVALSAARVAAGPLTPLLDSLQHYEYTWPRIVDSFDDASPQHVRFYPDHAIASLHSLQRNAITHFPTLTQASRYPLLPHAFTLASRHCHTTLTPAPRYQDVNEGLRVHPDQLHFEISAFNSTFHVNLKRNQDLFSSGYSHRYSMPDGSWRTEGELEHCYYHGSVAGDPSSVVAMSTCNGLRGFIAGKGHMLHLEPAHIHSTESTRKVAPEDPLRSRHIVFLAEHLQERAHCRATDHDHDHDHDHGLEYEEDYKPSAQHLLQSFLGMPKKPEKEASVGRVLLDDSYKPKPLWVELFVVNDQARYEQRSKPGYSSTEDVVNQMDALYRAGNFVPALRVRLVAQDTWASGNQIKFEGNPSNAREVSSPKLLQAFQQYRMVNFATLPKHDNAQLMSGVDFDGGASGLAVVGSMCHHKTSCSVNQITHALALNAAIAAHEMGHNFGMRHDSDANMCPQSGYIMNAVMVPGNTPDSWSSCSRTYIDEFLLRPSKYEGCLTAEEPTRGVSLPDVCGDGVLGPTEQCDCGSNDCTLRDPCCDGATCRFKSGAQCSDGLNFPCCNKCRFVSELSNKVCRPLGGTCDLEEFCSGESAYCGPDIFLPPGDTCLYRSKSRQLIPGKCYDGNCMTHAATCDDQGLNQPCSDPFKNDLGGCGTLWCVMNGVCGMIRSENGEIKTMETGVPCGLNDKGNQCLNGNCVESTLLPRAICPIIPMPAYATGAPCSGKTHGDSCSFDCLPNFGAVSGNRVVRCFGSEWNGVPVTCAPTSCFELSAPANAVNVGATCQPLIGLSCQFYCLPGFLPAAGTAATRTCAANGQWTEKALVCVSQVCPDLSPGENVEGTACIGALHGDYCKFACAVGSDRRAGSFSRRCVSGKWTSEKLECVRRVCTALSPGREQRGLPCISYGHGETCTFECSQGYTVGEGDATRICQQGLWSGETLACIRNECSTLNVPANADGMACSSVKTFSSCTFSCMEDYTSSGDATRTCLGTFWSGNALQCKAKVRCPILPAPSHVTGAVCSDSQDGQQCTFECQVGYTRGSGDLTRTCYGGSWGGTALSCMPQLCPDLVQPLHATGSTCSEQSHLQTCEFTCDSGYTRQSGITQRVCRLGKWDGEELVCGQSVGQCSDLTVPAHAMGEPCLDKRSGDTCLFGCATGYKQVHGSASRSCSKSGSWTGSALTCEQQVCTDLFSPSNSMRASCLERGQGSICQFSCLPKFSSRGNQVRECRDGEWSGQPLACANVFCPDLPLPKGAFGDPCVHNEEGEVCRYGCGAGFRRNGGNSARSCNAGNWTGTALTCEALPCLDLFPPPDADLDEMTNCLGGSHGAVCTMHCSAGFEPVDGNATRTCVLGEWDGSPLQCVYHQCPDLPNPTNAVESAVACLDKDEGDACQFKCAPGFDPTAGDVIRMCVHGEWTGSALTCEQPICPTITLSSGDFEATCSGRIHGETCSFACPVGFEVTGGSFTRTCVSGSWTGTSLTCEELRCRDFLSPPNTIGGKCNGIVHGQACKFECAEGHVHIAGNTTRQCRDGFWEGLPLICAMPGCPTISPGLHVVLVDGDRMGGGDTTIPGTVGKPKGKGIAGACVGDQDGRQCEFVCAPGFEWESGDYIRTCYDGIWSGADVFCVEKDMRAYEVSVHIGARKADVSVLLNNTTELHALFEASFLSDMCNVLQLSCDTLEKAPSSEAAPERALLEVPSDAGVVDEANRNRVVVNSIQAPSDLLVEAADISTVQVRFQLTTGIPRATNYSTPKELVARLKLMVKDRSSLLYSGEITSRIDPNFFRSLPILVPTKEWTLETQSQIIWLYIGFVAFGLLMSVFLITSVDSRLRARRRPRWARMLAGLGIFLFVGGVLAVADHLYDMFYDSFRLVPMLLVFGSAACMIICVAVIVGVSTCVALGRRASERLSTLDVDFKKYTLRKTPVKRSNSNVQQEMDAIIFSSPPRGTPSPSCLPGKPDRLTPYGLPKIPSTPPPKIPSNPLPPKLSPIPLQFTPAKAPPLPLQRAPSVQTRIALQRTPSKAPPLPLQRTPSKPPRTPAQSPPSQIPSSSSAAELAPNRTSLPSSLLLPISNRTPPKALPRKPPSKWTSPLAQPARRGLDDSFLHSRKGLDESPYSKGTCLVEENDENNAALANLDTDLDELIAGRLRKEMPRMPRMPPPKPPDSRGLMPKFKVFNMGQMDGRRRGPGYDLEGTPGHSSQDDDRASKALDIQKQIEGIQAIQKEQEQRYSTPFYQAPVSSRETSPAMQVGLRPVVRNLGERRYGTPSGNSSLESSPIVPRASRYDR